MSSIAVKVYSDVSHFASEVMPTLMSREAENQIMLAMLSNPAMAPSPFELMLSVRRNGQIVGAATKNLGREYNVIVSRMTGDEVVEVARTSAAQLKVPLQGVLGVDESAEAFAAEWTMIRGGSSKILFRQGVLQCDRLTSSPQASGLVREATSEDFQLMIEWRRQFFSDCGLDPEPEEKVRAHTQKIIDRRTLLVWVDGGNIVSMLNANSGPPNGGRIGLVYTPKHLRGRNYASACVAVATERFFKSGKKFGFLCTDLANPISNKIYERIGYVRVADSVDVRFTLG